MPKISKRYKKITEGLSADAFVDLKEAIKMLKEKATVKFDETVDIAMNLGVDPKHADQMVRGVVQLELLYLLEIKKQMRLKLQELI